MHLPSSLSTCTYLTTTHMHLPTYMHLHSNLPSKICTCTYLATDVHAPTYLPTYLQPSNPHTCTYLPTYPQVPTKQSTYCTYLPTCTYMHLHSNLPSNLCTCTYLATEVHAPTYLPTYLQPTYMHLRSNRKSECGLDIINTSAI